MDRRTFVVGLGALLTAPLASAAQPRQKVYRLGVLGGAPLRPETMAVLEQGLRDVGWIAGQNVVIERRSAEGALERLPALATELVDLKVDVIVALTAPETSAASQATRSIPIVFVAHGDPVGTGAVQSLAHPGGNVTGLSQMHPDLSAKQLELLKQLVPGAARIAVLWNAANPAKAGDWRQLTPAARGLGLALESREIRRATDLEATLATIKSQRPDALLVLSDQLMFSLRTAVADFAAKERLPTMCQLAVYVDAGGLVSYGADVMALIRRVGSYVDKILKGAKPADLPVEQATRFELVINMKTAKALGLTIPPSLLVRADRVIE